MSLAADPIAQALRSWLRAATGLADDKVIFARQPGPQPSWPYCAINPYLAVKSVGQEDEQQLGVGTLTVVHRRLITCDVNFYGAASAGDAQALATLAYDRLDNPSIRALLNAQGLSRAKRGTLQDLSFLGDTQFLARWQFEPQFNLVTTDAEAVNTIDTLAFTGTLHQASGPSVPVSGG